LQSPDNIRGTVAESVDLNKLLNIVRTNWIWFALVFIIANSVAYLITRYTKNLYESYSEIKLDVKTEASEFGIKSFVEDQYVNIVSGEIEIIQSSLFLNRVLDESSDFNISFVSVGRVLNDELFKNAPVWISLYSTNHPFYNTQITYKEIDPENYSLRIGTDTQETNARYGEKININGLELKLDRNDKFKKGDEVGYYFVILDREALLGYLHGNLTAEPLNYSANTIRIAFKDHNPFKAKAVLNKVDSIYLKYSNEQKNLANKQKIDWLVNELKHIESRMEDFENYFETFMLQNKTNNLEGDLERTIGHLNRADSQRYEIARRIRESDRLVVALQSENGSLPVSLRAVLPDYINRNIDEILRLQIERQKVAMSHSEITFAFKDKQAQIETLKNKTSELLKELREEWQKKLLELNRVKSTLEKEFASFPDKSTEFSKNQRFYKLYEEFYLTLMQSKSEFEIAQAGTIPDFKILSPASFPRAPISPHRLMILGIGLVASLVINFFLLGILYLVNNKITNISDLEKVRSASLLGSIPMSKYLNGGLHVLDHPKSMVSEAMRSLRTNLEFFNATSAQKIIAISSTVSGEGKSFIAMNLGGVVALSKKRVILVDLDMRKAKIEQPGGDIDNTKGVSTILIRKHLWTDCVVKTPADNFDFIPSGPHPPNPSELLLTNEFTELIANLKQSYDFIILDTPPVGLVTDGIMAMKIADTSIYIFRANYSKKDFVANLKRIITVNKFSNITMILNAVPNTGKTYGYGYYEEVRKKSKLKSLFQS
jgi:tyrosine-protein kinase Etk/Wzc